MRLPLFFLILLSLATQSHPQMEMKRFLIVLLMTRISWSILIDRKVSASFDFALSLLRAGSGHADNFVISPVSLGAALAIVHDGAKENTQEELTRLLGKSLSSAEVSALYSSLTTALSEHNSGVVTSIANRFFLDQDFTLKPEFASHIQNAYNASAETLNFKDREESANLVNAFVSSNTGGLIPNLVSADDFADSVAVLVNAVYFKGQWATQFKKDGTRMKPFHGVAGDRDAQLMRASELSARFSVSDNLTVVELKYKDPSYSFVALMPSGDFGEWRANLTAEKLQEAMQYQHSGKFNLELPKFKIEATTDGKKALEQLGVTRIFESTADLSEISNERIHVSKIAHKAVIEISEEGTEAAAAAEIVFRPVRLVIYPELVFDRPFVYAVVKDGAHILFVGQFVKASETEPIRVSEVNTSPNHGPVGDL